MSSPIELFTDRKAQQPFVPIVTEGTPQRAIIPAGVRDALARAIQLRRAVLDTERQLAERGQRVNEITAEQNRIRENMKTVAQNAQYYQRLLAKLNEQESLLEKLQGERDALAQKRDTERRALEEYLATLTVG